MSIPIFSIVKKKVFCIALLCIHFFFSSAQNNIPPKLDSFFNTLETNNKAMGSIAILKNGKLFYTKSIGFVDTGAITNLEDKSGIKHLKDINGNTKYRIGSITKMFTATLIFQLIDDKKIRLTTPLDSFFPHIPNASKITIGNLLNHRSGLRSVTDDKDYVLWSANPVTESEMLTKIENSMPEFEPDANAHYSNTNYVLLGYILEKLYGKPYKDIVKDRITTQIGLTHTYYGGKINAANNECSSFSFNGRWNKLTETDMSIPGGAGALVSTPTDLVTFIQALFDKKLVSDASLTQMKTMKDHIGMGMFVFPFGPKRAFGHTGGIDGFVSMVSYFPDDTMAIAYCTIGQVMPYNDVMIGVLSIYFGRPYKIPVYKAVIIDTADFDKYIGVYIPMAKMDVESITITRNKLTLMAQGKGQGVFPLEQTDKNTFKFDKADIVIEFYPDKHQMLLKQAGETFTLDKQK